MSEPDSRFANGFLAAARARLVQYDERRRELERAIDLKLASRDRRTNLFVALCGLAAVGVLLFLAVRAEGLPWYPAIPAVFYVLFAAAIAGRIVVHIGVALRGQEGQRDRAAKTNWAWWRTAALALTLFVWGFVCPGIENKTYFGVVAVAVLLLSMAESLHHRVRLLERNMREALLETELRLAKLIESAANPASGSDTDDP